jgi:hypothetical protein
MGSINKATFVALGMSIAGCSVESGGGHSAPQGVNPNDIKPADGADLAAHLGTAQAAHAQHYADWSNLWGETAYPMGTDNPNCMDWWVYDRYLWLAPPVGVWSYYSTYETWHPYVGSNPQGTPTQEIQNLLNTIPPELGWNTADLMHKNSVVDRTGWSKAGRCTGRYVFQWDNHDEYGTNNFPWNQYWVWAQIPQGLVPGSTNAACSASGATSVPSAWVDLYVCEAPPDTDIGSISSWCGVGSGNWRRFGGAGAAGGTYYPLESKCVVGAMYYYTPPWDKIAVSFNLVVKTGVGHGVAPADIHIYRAN